MKLGRAVFTIASLLVLAVVSGSAADPVSTQPAVPADTTTGQIKAVDKAISDLREAVTRDAKLTATSLAELKTELAALREQAGAVRPASALDPVAVKALDQVQKRMADLERLLVPGGDSADTAFPYPRLAAILAGLAAVLALVSVVSHYWIRPVGGNGVPTAISRQLGEVQKTLATLVAAPAGETAKDTLTGPTLAQGAEQLRAVSEKAARDGREFSTLIEQLSSVAGALQPTVDSLAARVAEIEQARTALSGERAELDRARADHAARDAQEAAARAAHLDQSKIAAIELVSVRSQLASYERFWPEPFRGEGPLAPWKERLVAAFSEGSAEAATLLMALIRWQVARAALDAEREAFVEATDTVGRAWHSFLAKEPPGGIEPMERTQLWTRAFKTPLEHAFSSLKLTAVYPGDRFDSDRMEAVGSISGGRQSVQRALSWSILEKTADTTRIVRRAQVITA